MAGASTFVDIKIRQKNIILFSKAYAPECKMVKFILDQYNLNHKAYEVVEIEKRQDCTQIENYFQIRCLTDSRSVPHLFVKGKYIGGEKEIPILHENGELAKILTQASTM